MSDAEGGGGVVSNRMQFNRGGISHPPKYLCPASGLNHVVLSVGYDPENETPYWIVNSSCGTGCGESVSLG
ncbi:hypothetical protein AHF37_09696 [Paragonimus kellicotti]|nr:hypothetical protein AHF37_09696 [Paragonimus kellicotti]